MRTCTEWMSFFRFFISMILIQSTFQLLLSARENANKIDRKKIVDRNAVYITKNNPRSPSQVGNGHFVFNMDITGLQTFTSFNTLSDWGWHTAPLPQGISLEDYSPSVMNTHGKDVLYDIPDPKHPEISEWLSCNPYRANLGRIGFVIKKKDGTVAQEGDMTYTSQKVDLWSGIVESRFALEGTEVVVKTVCHPMKDLLGVMVSSDLLKEGRLSVFFDFPYANNSTDARDYMGDYNAPEKHFSTLKNVISRHAVIERCMDDLTYTVSVNWNSPAHFSKETEGGHRFNLIPSRCSGDFSFCCLFDTLTHVGIIDSKFAGIQKASKKAWKKFWLSGAAVDLSGSKDGRWKELERRIVLSQYLMKLNESGIYPPQEAGLVNTGWAGRFHFEMIWWHGVHYGLWNRWELFERPLSVYQKFLQTSIERAKRQGYKGARWPKCTANIDRDWPHPIHATLIWQQPHPIYFAEMDYRLHPTRATLEKWKDIVFNTADFMADYACFDADRKEYVLGPPLYIVSENTDMNSTLNPTFELGYWRYGLRVASEWRKRLNMPEDAKWKEVMENLALLPVEDGLYVTYEGIDNMWSKYAFEHPALIGVWGMLPGDAVDKEIFVRTLDKVMDTWNLNHTWGWDFPMLAMAAARSGNPRLAVDLLLHPAPGFQFDEHGFCTGGPFPYFPANGGLLTAVAMMCGGWEGAYDAVPGFPKDGSWNVRCEGFNKFQ